MRGWSREKVAGYSAGRRSSPADDCVVETLFGRERILELGCGPALVAGRLSALQLVCTDITEGFLPVAKVNAPASTVLCADPVTLPFHDGVFDTVLAMAVLHHLKRSDLDAALQESCRVLNPGGWFLLLEDWAFTDPTPTEQEARKTRFAKGHDEFHLTWAEWDEAFGNAGFELLKRKWPERFFGEPSEGRRVRMMAALYARLP
jgi:SAM-dependent methyltransferase